MTKYNLKSAAGNKQPNFNFISSTAENNKSRVSYNLDEKYFNPSNQKLTISKPNQCTSPSNRIRTNNFLESSERKQSPLNRKLRDRNHPLRESLKNTHSRLSQRQRGQSLDTNLVQKKPTQPSFNNFMRNSSFHTGPKLDVMKGPVLSVEPSSYLQNKLQQLNSKIGLSTQMNNSQQKSIDHHQERHTVDTSGLNMFTSSKKKNHRSTSRPAQRVDRLHSGSKNNVFGHLRSNSKKPENILSKKTTLSRNGDIHDANDSQLSEGNLLNHGGIIHQVRVNSQPKKKSSVLQFYLPQNGPNHYSTNKKTLGLSSTNFNSGYNQDNHYQLSNLVANKVTTKPQLNRQSHRSKPINLESDVLHPVSKDEPMLGDKSGVYSNRFMQFMASKLVRKPKKRNILAYSTLSKKLTSAHHSKNTSYISNTEMRKTHDDIHFNTETKQRNTVGGNMVSRSVNNPLFSKKLFSSKNILQTEPNSQNSSFRKDSYRTPIMSQKLGLPHASTNDMTSSQQSMSVNERITQLTKEIQEYKTQVNIVETQIKSEKSLSISSETRGISRARSNSVRAYDSEIEKQIEEVNKKLTTMSARQARLVIEHEKNTQELGRRLEIKHQAKSNRRKLSKNVFQGSKELQAKNKALKRTYKNYKNHMDEMIDKRAENIKDISRKQLKLEIKLVEMRYGNDEFLVKKDLKEYVNQLESKQIDLKAKQMRNLVF